MSDRGDIDAAGPTFDSDPEGELIRVASRAKLFGGPREPVRIGRFEIVRRLGEGGMGTVYVARDPDLDREVALKLLRPDVSREGEARARLVREAKTLAKVVHPNVIGVFEVGQHENQLFVAMELVRGKTLRRFIADEQPALSRVLDVFVQAGRGLAAAHAVGLVHRDFKPDNVIVGDDGRVRVLDFGLAVEDATSASAEQRVTAPESGDLEKLTTTGTVLGTPAYLSPEQFEGRGADARSDQFAFSIALYEALWLEPPYPRDSFHLLRNAVLFEKPKPPPRTGSTKWLVPIVQRGLARDPAHRFPTMDALLLALADDPARRRRRRMRWLALGGGTATAAAFVILRASPPEPCAEAGTAIASVWDAARRDTVRTAVEAGATAFATATWERLGPTLDAYRDAWAASAVDNCRATRVEQRQSDAVMDRRHACLERARAAFGSLTDALAQASDGDALRHAIAAAQALPPIERCEDVERLLAAIDPPQPEIERDVEDLRARLQDVATMRALGRYADARERGDALLETAAALAHAPLLAETELQVGRALKSVGEARPAATHLERAHREAVACGHDEVAADAAIDLLHVWGERVVDREQAQRWADAATAWVDRVGDDDRRAHLWTNLGTWEDRTGNSAKAREWLQRALDLRKQAGEGDGLSAMLIVDNLAVVAFRAGDFAEAQRLHEDVLAAQERLLGPEHPDVGATLGNLANTCLQRGDTARAESLARRALELRRAALGDDHPDVAISWNNLAVLLQRTGRLTEARAGYERAIAIHERVAGPDAPDMIEPLGNLGALQRTLGELDAAIATSKRAHALHAKTWGETDARTARALANVGDALAGAGRFEEARETVALALASLEAALGPTHFELVPALTNLGFIESELGRHADAEAHHERAVTVLEQSVGAEHPMLAYPLTGLGAARIEQGRADAALEPLRRAVALWGEQRTAHAAHSRFVLARARWRAKDDRDGALAMARQALAIAEETGDAKMREKIAAFVARPG